MTTTTTRYALTKIVLGSDNVDVVNDFNNNWDAIDLRLGSQVCTSSTRPSSPVQGQEIYETDTFASKVYSGSSWRTVGNSTSTTGALPANPTQGDVTYLTDIGALAYYSGSAWHTASPFVGTSTSVPTGSAMQTGSMFYATDTASFLVDVGSSTWRHRTCVICTSTTRPTANLGNGVQIFETDTGLYAVYNGSTWRYQMGQIAPTQTMSATTASVTFSGLPALDGFRVKWACRMSDATAAEQLYLQFNGDTGSNYLWEVNQANNTTVAATTSAGATTRIQIGTVCAASATADYFATGEFVINTGSTGIYTTVVGTGTAYTSTSNMYAGVYSGQWNSTATVTSFTLFGASGSLITGSQFSLYALE